MTTRKQFLSKLGDIIISELMESSRILNLPLFILGILIFFAGMFFPLYMVDIDIEWVKAKQFPVNFPTVFGVVVSFYSGIHRFIFKYRKRT